MKQIETYKIRVTDILRSFRREYEDAKSESSRLIDGAAWLADRRNELIKNYRKQITRADKDLEESLKAEVEALQERVQARVLERPNEDALSILRAYRDFNLKVSPGELKSIAVRCSGDYFALRALQSLAEQSGYRVQGLPDMVEAERALASIQKNGKPPYMWAASGDIQAARFVLPDVPYRSDDGSVIYSTGRPDTITVNLAQLRIAKLEENFETVERFLNASPQPDMISIESLAGEERAEAEQANLDRLNEALSGIQVDADSLPAELASQAEGQRKAQAAELNRRVLDAYLSGQAQSR